MNKGAIISLSIFLIVGLVVSSVITSGVDYEKLWKPKADLESNDDNASGSSSASVLMGFYDENHLPIETETHGLTTLYKTGTTQQVTSFDARIYSITVAGEMIDLDTLNVQAQYILKDGSKEHWIQGRDFTRADFDITGNNEQFNAKAKKYLGDSVTFFSQLLVDHGDLFNIDYKKNGYKWIYIMRFETTAKTLDGQAITADLKQFPMSIETDVAGATLRLNADVRATSILPTTIGDAVIQFFIIVLFVGLWYWKGQHWIPWN